tara:strand:- start:203 stop:403 length:201 start_codon:yes stop_codon:yes gene_type:complete
MHIDEDILKIEKEKLQKDFDTVKAQIQKGEIEIGSMKSNLNALHGAIQQTEKLIAMVSNKKEQEKK